MSVAAVLPTIADHDAVAFVGNYLHQQLGQAQ
eukprot:SAG11_NODE_46630_length_135_cov_25.750000_1_plen_31_part_01